MKHTVLISCLSGVIYEQLIEDTNNEISYSYDNLAKTWTVKLSWYIDKQLMSYRVDITDYDLDTIYQNLIIQKYTDQFVIAYNNSLIN